MEDAPSLLKNSEVRMSRYLDTSTTTQMDQIMVQHGRSGRSSPDGKKFQFWECFSFIETKDYSCSVYVDDIKLNGKKQHLDPMWKIRMKRR